MTLSPGDEEALVEMHRAMVVLETYSCVLEHDTGRQLVQSMVKRMSDELRFYTSAAIKARRSMET